MARRKNKAPHQPDTRGKKFIGLPACLLESEAYRALSYPARSVLIEIALRFNGFNNGEICVSQRQIMTGLGTKAPATVINAIKNLMESGIIAVETEGQWHPRMSREYRLTYVNTTNGNGKHIAATNDYLNVGKLKSKKICSSADEPDTHGTDTALTSEDNETDTVSTLAVFSHSNKIKDLDVSATKPTDTVSTPHITKPYPRQRGWGLSRNELVMSFFGPITGRMLNNNNENDAAVPST